MTADFIEKKELAAVLREEAKRSLDERTRPYRHHVDMIEDAIARATEATLNSIADALDPKRWDV